MKLRIILFLLFFTIISTTCSEKDSKQPKSVRQSAVQCLAIVDNEKDIPDKLQKKHKDRIVKHGFESDASLHLHYNTKHKRGVLYYDNDRSYHEGNHVGRLKISQEDFSTISQKKYKSNEGHFQTESKSTLNHGKLQNPLYIAAETKDRLFMYKITSIEVNQPLEIYEAGYDSDREENIKRYFAGGIVGFSGGLVIGIAATTFFLLFYKFKQLFHVFGSCKC